MSIKIPSECPSCAGPLEITGTSILYCKNKLCPAQGLKSVEHFSKTLRILGLGPSAIQKLQISSIPEIYNLREENCIEALGPALGTKLFANIKASTSASLNAVLAAMGIPLIGKTASDKICAKVGNIEDITFELALETLGPKSAANLLAWIETKEWMDLPFSFCPEKVTSGKTVCITGKLTSFKTKNEAAKYLQNKGYVVVSSITKTTDILVNESGIASEKTKKASANGTLIINNILEL